MNATATLLAAVFLAVAALDWVAVHHGNERIRVLTKPGCMVALIACASAIDPADAAARRALLVALCLSTLGDIFLLGETRTHLFVAGLGAFLFAHLAYVAGFWIEGVELAGLALGLVLAGVLVSTVGRRIVAAVEGGDEAVLAAPVRAYVAVIAVMVLSAAGTTDGFAIAGAVLFASSDSLIAWRRFVEPRPGADLTIMVTYHLAQLLLVVSFT